LRGGERSVTQLRAEILVGQRYRFLQRIGTAQFTETWKAFDTRLGRPVALQLLSEPERNNVRAQADLRATARGQKPSAARVLDGGDDPIYGPFVVAELGDEATAPPLRSAVVTQPLPALDRAEPERSPERGRLGLLVLVGAILLVLMAFVFAARMFGPADQSTAAAGVSVTPLPPSRPLSGAPATPVSSLAPALAAPQPAQATQQPTSRPTSPPANQTAAQPTPQASAQAAGQSQLPQGSPADTIRQHYAFIDAKRYADGYSLMDAHLRSLNSAADYQSWFVDKISVKPISVDVTSQTDTEAVVHSVVDTTDRVDGQNVTKQVSEEFVLHAENGAWRIDQVSRL
jgi:predicted lipid-binding transport protein (Tim44 family)